MIKYPQNMKLKVLQYNVIIKKEGTNFIAYVPTLGISDFGKSIDIAKKNIQAAIECHIEGLLKTESDIPTPDIEDYYVSQMQVKIPGNIKLAF